MPLGRVLPDGLHRQPFAVHHRMVADNQLAVFRDGLVRHGLRDVQGHQHPLDLRLRVPQQLAHVVPVHGALLRGQSEQGAVQFPGPLAWRHSSLIRQKLGDDVPGVIRPVPGPLAPTPGWTRHRRLELDDLLDDVAVPQGVVEQVRPGRTAGPGVRVHLPCPGLDHGIEHAPVPHQRLPRYGVAVLRQEAAAAPPPGSGAGAAACGGRRRSRVPRPESAAMFSPPMPAMTMVSHSSGATAARPLPRRKVIRSPTP